MKRTFASEEKIDEICSHSDSGYIGLSPEFVSLDRKSVYADFEEAMATGQAFYIAAANYYGYCVLKVRNRDGNVADIVEVKPKNKP